MNPIFTSCKRFRWLHLALIVAVIVSGGGITKGQGHGKGGGGMPVEFQEKIHELFANPDKLIRKVDIHEKGYVAETTTSDPELVGVLQAHVEEMSGRLGKEGRPVRRWDPAFEEFFAHYNDMVHKFIKLENGIRAEVTGNTPEAISAAHNHARIILEFSTHGDGQMHQPHRTAIDEDGGESKRFRGGPSEARNAELAGTFGGRANKASNALMKSLGGQLKAALQSGGPEAALSVCKTVAIPLTKATEVNYEGLTVKRVTDKPRNPENAADKQDLAVMNYFRESKPEPKLLEHLTTAEDGKTVRYYRPLAVAEVCTKCHGPQEGMPKALSHILADLYPDDKAHGYFIGDLRGLIRVEANAP